MEKVAQTDYMAKVELDGKQVEHRLGCSGIDGVSFGPKFGKKGGKMYLTTTYGVYSDTKRSDNDYQVLLQYDIADWRKYERPLSQDNMHTFGPEKPDGQYFAYTGNTTYGVQNIEYDEGYGGWPYIRDARSTSPTTRSMLSTAARSPAKSL